MNLIINMDNKVKDIISNSWTHVLHEVHGKKCDCSYCYGENKEHYGLNIPQDKSWNGWWVFKYWNKRYVRWTNRFLKRFK